MRFWPLWVPCTWTASPGTNAVSPICFLRIWRAAFHFFDLSVVAEHYVDGCAVTRLDHHGLAFTPIDDALNLGALCVGHYASQRKKAHEKRDCCRERIL